MVFDRGHFRFIAKLAKVFPTLHFVSADSPNLEKFLSNQELSCHGYEINQSKLSFLIHMIRVA